MHASLTGRIALLGIVWHGTADRRICMLPNEEERHSWEINGIELQTAAHACFPLSTTTSTQDAGHAHWCTRDAVTHLSLVVALGMEDCRRWPRCGSLTWSNREHYKTWTEISRLTLRQVSRATDRDEELLGNQETVMGDGWLPVDLCPHRR